MSFRKKTNRHDYWKGLIEVNRSLLEATTLPTEVFADRDRFHEFLTTGSFEVQSAGVRVKLAELTDEEFLRLERVVCALLDSLFFAFDHERLRRFNRYGPPNSRERDRSC